MLSNVKWMSLFCSDCSNNSSKGYNLYKKRFHRVQSESFCVYICKVAYVTIPLELRFEALNKNYSIGVKLIAAE